MKITGIYWDDGNIEHIGIHGINPAEVEDICFETHIAYSGAHQRYIIYGKTKEGRYLKVILKRLHGTIYKTITAFEMSESEKHTYRKRVK